MYPKQGDTPKQEWSLGPRVIKRSGLYGASIDSLVSTGKKYAPFVLAASIGALIGYAAGSSIPSNNQDYSLSATSYSTPKK